MAKGQRKKLRERQQRAANAIDVDKGTSVGQTSSKPKSSQVEHVLRPQHGSGVQKSKPKKPLRRNQRLRLEKGAQRAEAVTEQLEKKVTESKQKGKKIKSRRHDWEDVNDALKVLKPVSNRNTNDSKVKQQDTGQNSTDDVPDQSSSEAAEEIQ